MKLPITLIITLLLLCATRMGAEPARASSPADTTRMETSQQLVAAYHRQLSRNYAFTRGHSIAHLLENTPVDTLVDRFIDRKYATLSDTVSLIGYLTHKRWIVPRDEMSTYIQHLSGDLCSRYDSKDLARYLELMEIAYLHINDDSGFEAKMPLYERFLRKARKWNDPALEAYTLQLMWLESYDAHYYAYSFRYAPLLEEALDRVKDAEYTRKSDDYFKLGSAYYHFKDYDRATRLMHKSIAIEPHLQAWNYLATMHDMNGRLDSAAYYHQAILQSNKTWKEDPIHLAVAISNLGRIEMQTGNYDDALCMLQIGLRDVMHRWDVSFRVGIRISLAECYLEKGDTAAVRREIATTQAELDSIEELYKPLRRIAKLHALRSRYYQHLGQPHLSKLYQDSAMAMSSRYEQETGRHIIVLGEQQAAEQLKDQEIAGQRNIIIGTIAALVLIMATLIIIIRLYRRRDAAYKKLAQKALEWSVNPSETPPATTPPLVEGRCPEGGGVNEPTEEDLHIMQLADREMTEHHAYREPTFNMDAMADRIGVHRNTFSRAVNRVTGGNFNQYINSYRIKEAIRIIYTTDRSTMYIDELSERVGYNSRASFYRAFKQFTGLTPLEFQKRGAHNQRL